MGRLHTHPSFLRCAEIPQLTPRAPTSQKHPKQGHMGKHRGTQHCHPIGLLHTKSPHPSPLLPSCCCKMAHGGMQLHLMALHPTGVLWAPAVTPSAAQPPAAFSLCLGSSFQHIHAVPQGLAMPQIRMSPWLPAGAGGDGALRVHRSAHLPLPALDATGTKAQCWQGRSTMLALRAHCVPAPRTAGHERRGIPKGKPSLSRADKTQCLLPQPL